MKLTGGDHVAREMKFLYDKADYDAMREKLGAVDWKAELKEGPIEESWLFFKQKLHTVLDRYTPNIDLKGGVKKKPWMDTKPQIWYGRSIDNTESYRICLGCKIVPGRAVL